MERLDQGAKWYEERVDKGKLKYEKFGANWSRRKLTKVRVGQ